MDDRAHGTSPLTRGFTRFALVGGLGFLVDASVLTLLVNGLDKNHLSARAVSFALAVTVTWLANRHWTFEPTQHRGKEYAGYITTQIVGAVINLGIYVVLIALFPDLAKTPVIPLACGALVALIFNFFAARRFVFQAIRQTDSKAVDPVRSDSGFTYSGVDNLEAMQFAQKYNRFLTQLVTRHVDGTAVLDFGAGAGTFAVPVASTGLQVSCLEPDPTLRSQLSADGFATYAELSQVPPNSVDSIYTLNVLEHIEDDDGALVELARCLRQQGRLIIYVPAFDLLYSAMDRQVGHFRRYRRPQLIQKLAASGFRVRTARYIDSLGFLAALLYKLVERGDGTLSPKSVELYDRFVFPISLVIDRLTGGRFGKNLLVVADLV
jgi:putative flippase GtrA/ubiquinone/menaquinone biosynthesis C-methylase UbiE